MEKGKGRAGGVAQTLAPGPQPLSVAVFGCSTSILGAQSRQSAVLGRRGATLCPLLPPSPPRLNSPRALSGALLARWTAYPAAVECKTGAKFCTNVPKRANIDTAAHPRPLKKMQFFGYNFPRKWLTRFSTAAAKGAVSCVTSSSPTLTLSLHPSQPHHPRPHSGEEKRVKCENTKNDG